MELDGFVKPLRKAGVDGLTLLKLEDDDYNEAGAPAGLKRKKLQSALEKFV